MPISHVEDPLYRLTAHDLYVLAKENPHSQDRAFSKENLIALQRDCAAKVVALREADHLIFHPNLGALLRFLEAQEGVEKIRAWVAVQSADDTRLLTLLTGLFGRQESSGSGRRSKMTVRFYIARASLKRLFSLDAAFKSRLEKIDLSAANKWQKLAVEETLRHIDYEGRGIQEADYGMPVE